MEVPEANQVIHRRDEIAKTLRVILSDVRTVHHGHMPEIELPGEGTAKGTCVTPTARDRPFVCPDG